MYAAVVKVDSNGRGQAGAAGQHKKIRNNTEYHHRATNNGIASCNAGNAIIALVYQKSADGGVREHRRRVM